VSLHSSIAASTPLSLIVSEISVKNFWESIDDTISEYARSIANPSPKTSEIKMGHINAPPSMKY
jgi:hypothetical protein